jgi:hypothetical protein
MLRLLDKPVVAIYTISTEAIETSFERGIAVEPPVLACAKTQLRLTALAITKSTLSMSERLDKKTSLRAFAPLRLCEKFLFASPKFLFASPKSPARFTSLLFAQRRKGAKKTQR